MKTFTRQFVSGLLMIGLGQALTAALAGRPNVVLIVVDDLGWRDLSGQGSTFYETPHVDRIARSGTTFTNGYSTSPVCSPARGSLMTGCSPARIGITEWIGAKSGSDWDQNTVLLSAPYRHELPADRTTIAETFKAAGYATFFAGKWHLGDRPEDLPEAHGFDFNKGGGGYGSPPGGYFSPYKNPRLPDGPPGEYLPFRLAQETATFITAHKDRPFLAVLSFYSVHGPDQTTKALWEKYRAKALAQPRPEKRFAMERRKAERQVQDHPIYGGMVEAMDQSVGIVMAALEENDLRENTIIVFTSDNGGVSSGDSKSTSNQPLRGGKGYQWEGGTHIPLYVSWPARLPEGATSSVRVTGADLYPTLADLAGLSLKPGQQVDGVSLRPLLTGGKLPGRDLFWHYPHYSNQGGDPTSIVISDDWKLIHYYEDDHDELYHLTADPVERVDLAANYPDQTSRLRRKLDAWLQDVGAVFPEKNPSYNAAKARQSLEREREVAMPLLEREAADFLKPDFTPPGGWWQEAKRKAGQTRPAMEP
jgi:arylsulfatase A-like enzyme